jgi:hypothetical protein
MDPASEAPAAVRWTSAALLPVWSTTRMDEERRQLLANIAASTVEQLADVLAEQEAEVASLTIEVTRLGVVIEKVHETIEPVVASGNTAPAPEA